MRSKEEIAAIADEIAKNVRTRHKIEEYVKISEKMLKKYFPGVMQNMLCIDALTGSFYGRPMQQRVIAAIGEHIATQEAFEAYRKRVEEKLAEEKGLEL